MPVIEGCKLMDMTVINAEAGVNNKMVVMKIKYQFALLRFRNLILKLIFCQKNLLIKLLENHSLT